MKRFLALGLTLTLFTGCSQESLIGFVSVLSALSEVGKKNNDSTRETSRTSSSSALTRTSASTLQTPAPTRNSCSASDSSDCDDPVLSESTTRDAVRPEYASAIQMP